MRVPIRFCLALFAALLALAGVALAQQDAFCICVDPTDPADCGGNVDIPAFVPTNIYLCMLNPSGNQILAWEGRITQTNASSMIGTWVMSGLDVDNDPQDFVIGNGASPLVPNAQDVVVMGQMQVIILNASTEIEFFVGPIPGSVSFPEGTPGYVHTLGIVTPATVCGGDFTSPVLSINGDNPPPFENEFSVTVAASLGAYRDLGNIAGMGEEATDGLDPDLDIPEPPVPPSGYVSLSFPHSEWASPLGEFFRTDIRASYVPSTTVKTWALRFLTDQSGVATLTFQPSFDQAANWELTLIDLDTGEVEALWDSALGYSFNAMPGQVRRFELLVGPNQIPPLNPTSRLLPTGWSLVGMPLLPNAPGTVGSVLLDDIVSTAFVYGHNGNTGYQQALSTDVMQQGRGYWVGATNPFTWTMEGNRDLNGASLSLAAGWNLLGGPLWTAVSLDDIEVDYQGVRHDYATAVQMGLVGNYVYMFQNSTGTYVPQINIQPWHGYWLPAYMSGVGLWFHYTNIGPDKTDSPAPAFEPDDLNWRLSLGLDGAPESVTVGRLEKAAAGFDPTWDQPRPPRAPVAASRPELWLDGAALDLSTGDQLTADYRAADGSDVAWDLVVTAPAPGPVTLRWDAAEWGGHEDLQLYLPHQNRVAVMSMRAQSSLTLDVGAGPLVVRLRTPDLSTAAPEAAAARCSLRAVPNPFNPRTEFVMSLPRAGKAEVRIHDVLGRLVKRLEIGAGVAGENRITWQGIDEQGREVASGTYFAALHLDGVATGAVVRLSLVR